jgi:hypothetical protein
MKQTRSHLIAGICMASILLLGTATAREAGVIDMAAFGAKADGSDTTPSLRAALDAARSGKASKLTFAPGRYDFRPERAGEQYLFVSNNDEGLKRIAFPLTDIKGLEIDGGGSTFVFHGYTVPFLIEESSGTGTIQVGSGIADESRKTSRYNRNIKIEKPATVTSG